MSQVPPSGQPPIDPSGAFSPPPPPNSGPPGGWSPPPVPPPGMMPPPPRRPGGPPPMPPQMMMPPPMYYPPPPREKSFGRAILTTLGTTIFGLSLALNVYLILLVSLSDGVNLQKTLVDGDVHEVVAVIPVSGLIDGDAFERFNRNLMKVEKEKSTKAIVVEVDSPGGTVTASDEIYNRIKLFRSEHPKIPVIISMRSLAASGGYYVACAGEYIFAEPTTTTGSIGVLLPKYNFSKLADKYGIEDTSQHSTGADFKTAGSPFKPERPMDTTYFQEFIDAAFDQFKGIVSTSRSGQLTRPIDEIANGKIYTSTQARTLGLVDQIGYPQDAWKYAAGKAGLKNPSVIKYEEPDSLFELLGAKSSVPGLKGSTVTGSGTTVNLNVNLDVHKVLNGHSVPMYLFRVD